MSSNIDVRVQVDVTDLTAKMAVARAESSAFTKELNSLAKEATQVGPSTADFGQKLAAAAEQSVAAKSKVADLRAELSASVPAASSFSSAIETAVPVLGQFGAALSIGAIVGFSKSLIAMGADIQHQADALGIGAEDLQTYQYAARESGVEVDQATTALKRFSAGLGELQITGEGPLAKDLLTLGLTADELSGPPLEALIIFARALDQIKDATTRAAIERDAFSRSGVDLTALMHKLAESGGDVRDALDEIKNKARDAGQMIDGTTTKAMQHLSEDMDGFTVRAKAGVVALAEFIGQVEALQAAKTENLDLNLRLAAREKLPEHRPVPAGAQVDQTGHPPSPAEVAALKASGTLIAPEIPQPTEPKIDIAKPGDANKAAEQARRIADEVAQAWQATNEKRIEGEQQLNNFLLANGQETLDAFIAQARKLEDDRYKIELDGLKARERNDKGDAVAFAKDKAQEQVIAQEDANRKAAIEQEYAQKKKQISATELQDFIKTENDRLEVELSTLDKQVSEHRLSDQEAHDLERQLTQAIQQEVLRRFDAENLRLQKGTEAYAKAMKERQAIVDGFNKKVAEQDNKLEQQESQKWHELASSIEGSINSAFSQMIVHGGSFQQFMVSVTEGVADAFLQAGLKMAEDWIERQIMAAVSTETTQAASSIAQINAVAGVAGANAYAAWPRIPL